MKVKAIDTLHISSVKDENIAPGDEFDIADDVGKQLLDRKLVEEVKGNKAEAAPQNKMDAAPVNKSAKDK